MAENPKSWPDTDPEAWTDEQVFFAALHLTGHKQKNAYQQATLRISHTRSRIVMWCRRFGVKIRKVPKILRDAVGQAVDVATGWPRCPQTDPEWLANLAFNAFCDTLEDDARDQLLKRVVNESSLYAILGISPEMCRKCMNLLSFDLQEIVERWARGETFPHIATAMGLDEDEVSDKFFTAMRRIRDCLDD
ncbi:hypothetical protein GC163_24585 [bacterium]|nr:hypothetical protein [bacterium]